MGGTEASAEEQFKIWAFRAALSRVSKLPPADLQWLAERAPGAVKVSAKAAQSSTEAGDANAPSQLVSVIDFLQTAAVFVTGGNLENLSHTALIIFSVLVELPDGVRFMQLSQQHQEQALRAPPSAPQLVQQEDAAAAEGNTSAAAPLAPKPIPKTKLLAALWARFYSLVPPAPRSKALPAELEMELQMLAAKQHRAEAPAARKTSQAAGSAKTALAAKGDEKAPKPVKEAKAPSSAQQGAASGACDDHNSDDEPLFVVNAPDGTASAAAVKLRTVKVATRRSPQRVAPVDGPIDANLLTSRVASLVHALSVTTPKVLLDRLRQDPSFASITHADLHAAISRLCASDFLVMEHGVIYPL